MLGDSTKTTILNAIEYVLYPYYNLSITDFDFYNCTVEEKIVIDITVGDIPNELLTEDKYGLYIRKFVINDQESDEPNNEDKVYLTIRLEIDEFFQCEWKVITDRNDGKSINYKDRSKLRIGKIGENFYKDFNLGRGSVLNNYTSNSDELNKLILTEFRKIRNSIDFSSGQEIIKDIIEKINLSTKDYGVAPQHQYSAKLDIKISDNGFSNISIYDGNVPLLLNGTGTKRLMSSAMNIYNLSNNSIILIDEIEYGLEPYRLRQLISNLKDFSLKGQVIFSSHSSISVVEVEAKNIVICKSNNGITECINIPNELQDIARSIPEALLSKKVIVTEGKTEYGILKSLDKKWAIDDKNIEYYGTSIVEGCGDNTIIRAKKLKELGYDVLIFVDSDKNEMITKAEELADIGVKVMRWKKNVSTDEQIFIDIPENKLQILINEILKYIINDTVENCIKNGCSLDIKTTDYNLIKEKIGEQLARENLGSIAKKNSWYKTIDKGYFLGDVIIDSYNELEINSDLKTVLEGIKDWAYGN